MGHNYLAPFLILENQSMATDFVTDPVESKLQDNMGFQVNWGGSPMGTFSIEISADYAEDRNGNVLNAGNWVTLPLNPIISALGSADSGYFDLNQLSSPWIRLRYTAVSGLGFCDVYAVGKGV